MRNSPTTYPTPPLELPVRAYREPVPVADCAQCTALGRRRAGARRDGDLSKVSDCNVEIARHPHGGEKEIDMGTHGDGKGGADGDKQQSPKESDGQWTKPVSNPPKK